MLAEDAPERLTLAKQANLGLAEGDDVFPQGQAPANFPDMGRRKIGQICFLVARKEVENIVYDDNGKISELELRKIN